MSALARFIRDGHLWRVDGKADPVPYTIDEYTRMLPHIRDASQWFAIESAAIAYVEKLRRAN